MRRIWSTRHCAQVLPAVLVAVLVLVNWIALISLPTLPFTDLPNHLAESVIFRQSHNPNSALNDFFRSEVAWFRPNIAHIVLWSVFPTAELGARITYLFYIAAVPLLIALLIRLADGDRWFCLYAGTTLWNFATVWGFIGCTVAIPLVLLLVALHVRALTRPTPAARTWLLLSFVLLVLYWTHVQVFLLALAYVICAEMMESRVTRSALNLGRLSTVLPGLALFVIWIRGGYEFADVPVMSFLSDHYRQGYLSSLAQRILLFLWNDHARLAEGAQGRVLGQVFTLSILAPLIFYAIWRATRAVLRRTGRLVRAAHAPGDAVDVPLRKSAEASVSSRARRASVCFTLLAALGYLGLPAALPNQAFVFQRLSVFVVLGMIGVLAWLVPPRHRFVLRFLAVGVAGLYGVLWCQYFAAYGRQARAFTPEFLHVDTGRGEVLGAIIEEADFRGSPVFNHFNAYHIVWNRGVTTTRLVDYRFGAIRRATEATVDVLPKHKEWIYPTTDIDALVEYYQNCAFLLVRGDRPYMSVRTRGEHDLVRTSDGWALFRKKTRSPGE